MAGDLFVKYQAGDNGTRPIAPCTNFWSSPSVWLTDVNGNGLNEAQVGEDNIINVQVDSKSATARTAVKVQVWVCDFTLGGVGPGAVLLSGSAGGPSGRTATVPTGVSSSTPGIAQVHWTPVDADLINSADKTRGHVCAGASTYVEGAKPEGAIKTSGLLDVCNDQHHAWKNLTVVKSQNFRHAEMSFRMVNPLLELAEFVIETRELERDEAMGQLELEQLLTADFVQFVPKNGGKPEPVPPGCMTEPRERTLLREGGRLVLTGLEKPVALRPAREPAAEVGVVAEGGEGGKATKLTAAAGDRVPVTLVAELKDSDPGEVHTFEITQADERGRIVGGARVIVVAVPEWHTG
jgi:hypothetical protein